MQFDEDAFHRKADLAQEATERGSVLFGTEDRKADFNRGCDHIFGLLTDAHALYVTNSYATAVFLSITAIEEVAKDEIAIYRRLDTTQPASKRRDDC
ncbi:AbiV family abortive infection protein [Cupriavidus pauculus]|uniref:AbiV family abortive infection protein n=1 Tax=Cupriavidus pauculus TaxID=82633 RepID=UPI001C935336|nr:AbiV family abortive infection protein [Cupriavidus pauculus]MBY4734012.1 AbiV family abortive infection protein [Cupriavidus pauculus]